MGPPPSSLHPISHLGCINTPALHILPCFGGGGCGGGGLHGFSAALWHQSREMAGFFVMQTPLASCLIQMSALLLSPLSHSINPYPVSPFSSTSDFSTPCPHSHPPSQVQVNPRWEEPPGPGLLRQASLLGVSRCLSAWGCFQAQPSLFHIQMLQSGLWPTGGSLWLRLQVVGSRWWFNSSGRGKERGSKVI